MAVVVTNIGKHTPLCLQEDNFIPREQSDSMTNFDLDYLSTAEIEVAVSCSPVVTLWLGGVGFGSWLMGKLGRVWVVHGWSCMGGNVG